MSYRLAMSEYVDSDDGGTDSMETGYGSEYSEEIQELPCSASLASVFGVSTQNRVRRNGNYSEYLEFRDG